MATSSDENLLTASRIIGLKSVTIIFSFVRSNRLSSVVISAEVLKYTTSIIIDRMQKKEFPFDDELIKNYYSQFLEMSEKK